MGEQEDSFFLETGEDANSIHGSLNTHKQTLAFVVYGTHHRRNGFYTVQTVFSINQHINLPLTEN